MPIARLYETEQQAQDAAAKLSSMYPDSTVHLITPSSGGDAAATLKKGGFDADDAAAYAAEIAKGRSLVANSPAFRQGVPVKATLDEFGPIPMGPLPSARPTANSRYTPFSEALGWNLLTNRTQQAWWWGDLLRRPDVISGNIPRLRRTYNLSFGIPRLRRMYNVSFGIPRLNRMYNLSFGIPRLNRAYNLSFGIPRLIINR
jgi:uncharacterized protein YbaR (Trm112 family)